MKIEVFKKRFIQLTHDQQETAIMEMSKATPETEHMKGVPEENKEATLKAYWELVEWCKQNKKSVSLKLNQA